jgi:hypothetical protein
VLGSCAQQVAAAIAIATFSVAVAVAPQQFLECCEPVAIATIFEVSGRNSQPQHFKYNYYLIF